jgi:hypothetical protein
MTSNSSADQSTSIFTQLEIHLADKPRPTISWCDARCAARILQQQDCWTARVRDFKSARRFLPDLQLARSALPGGGVRINASRLAQVVLISIS